MVLQRLMLRTNRGRFIDTYTGADVHKAVLSQTMLKKLNKQVGRNKYVSLESIGGESVLTIPITIAPCVP